MPPEASAGIPTKEIQRAENARAFRDIVGRSTANEPSIQWGKENSCIAGSFRVQLGNNTKIEFMHGNPNRVGQEADIDELANDGLFIDIIPPDPKVRTGRVPQEIIVISKENDRTRTTFALFPEGDVVRTHVVGASSEYIRSFAGPSASDIYTHTAVVSRELEPEEVSDLLTYVRSPHLEQEAGVRAIQLNREE